MIRLQPEPLSVDAALAAVASPDCGGTTVFIGTVRADADTPGGRPLRYEAYGPMALREMERLEASIRERHPGARAAILHRTGDIPIGEASVVIAVAAPHRDEAFAACREAIEELKKNVPIWKEAP